MTNYPIPAVALLLAAAESGEQSVPQWAWVLLGAVVMPLSMKVIDALWSKATKSEEKQAAAAGELAKAQAAGIEALRSELHALRVELPTMISTAKHDAVNAVLPQLLALEKRLRETEESVIRMDERGKKEAA